MEFIPLKKETFNQYSRGINYLMDRERVDFMKKIVFFNSNI